ncbi:tyrosine-type recombinase/integrase [Lysobacter sp. KIS68-7]|uniref:tyrosine-type recombinase/integrase n=1 Tax=Lysobacter sp. KIS68-7 TaxID=2904252 RepID=UPI001E315B6B|nr:tyrosine-type recombinase/integrase [Lysobacter sp. KIS68-7]UHQ19519.1 tyrosine-type recombinase/integrase [Lysobacter sp. KIS68-7]
MAIVVRFTEARVKELRAKARPGKRDEYQDADVSALRLRVSTKSASWSVLKRIPGGDMKRVGIGKADDIVASEARKRALVLVGDMQKGIDPNAEKRQRKKEDLRHGLTLGEGLDIYLAEKDLREATRRTYERDLRTTFGDYWDRPLVDLTPDVVRNRHRDRKNRALRSQARVQSASARKRITASPSRADGAVRALRAVVNYLKVTRSIDLPDVAAQITATGAWGNVRRRKRALGDRLDDFVRAVRALPHDLPPDLTGTQRDLTLFLLCTALRWSSGAGLRWDEVDFKSKTVTICADRMKGKAEHSLPLGPELLAMLRARFAVRRSNEYVFPGLPKTADEPDNLRPFGRITKHFTAKIVDGDGDGFVWSPHDLRRTALNVLESMDVSAYALKRIAAHSEGDDVTAGYLTDDVSRLRAPMERLEARVFGRRGKVVELKKPVDRRR